MEAPKWDEPEAGWVYDPYSNLALILKLWHCTPGGGRKPAKAGVFLQPLPTPLTMQWHSSHTRGPSQQRPSRMLGAQASNGHSQGWDNYNPRFHGQRMTASSLEVKKEEEEEEESEEDSQSFVSDKTNRSLNRGWGALRKRKERRSLQQAGQPASDHLQPNKVSLNEAQQAERRELQQKLNNLQQAYPAVETKGKAKKSGQRYKISKKS